MKELQAECGSVRIGDKLLENVFNFSYLGSDSQANGDHSHANGAMKVRVAQAKERFGSMWQIGEAPELPTEAKLRLYSAGVVAVLTHGYETWSLDAEALSSLKGWNARFLCRITGRDVADECRHPTIDLPKRLRARWLRWAVGQRSVLGGTGQSRKNQRGVLPCWLCSSRGSSSRLEG